MEGIPTSPDREKEPRKEEFSGSKTLEEIASIQRGRNLSDLSVKELTSIKEKYTRLKQELNIDGNESKEGAETSYEQAKEIMGESFYGIEEINNTFGFDFPSEKIPPIPYNEDVLEKAKENGEMLVLRVKSDGTGSPMTMQRMNEIMETILEKDSEEEQEKLLYDTDWYKEEDFFKNSSLKTEWRIVGREFIPDSTSKNYIEQTKILRDHLFGLKSLSEEEKTECTDELLEELQKMLDEDYDKNWQEVAKKLSELLINKNHRRIPAEILYDWILRFKNRKEIGILEENYDWSNTLSSDGGLVYLGSAGRDGVRVGSARPGHRYDYLGVVSLR